MLGERERDREKGEEEEKEREREIRVQMRATTAKVRQVEEETDREERGWRERTEGASGKGPSEQE